MPPLFSGQILHVNLSERKIEERELPEQLIEERIGGAAIISTLMGEIGDCCISLGSGALTGVPCPAASASVAGLKDSNGNKRYTPILLNAGLELKLCGFDFVVVEGRADKPVYLWVRDQVADIVECEHLAADTWAVCSKIREEQGDPRIQVISSSEGACASLNYVSGWDFIGFGNAMRETNLRAIAFRGMGELEIEESEKVLTNSSEMMKAAKGKVGSRAGIGSLLPAEVASKLDISRNRACFSCPFPCMSYVKTDSSDFPEMLLMDQRSLLKLSETQSPSDESSILNTLMRLHRKGRCPDEKKSESGSPQDQSTKCCSGTLKFDTMTDNIDESELIAAGFVLGICPRYLGAIGDDLSGYCELLSIASGKDISADKVLELSRVLLRGE